VIDNHSHLYRIQFIETTAGDFTMYVCLCHNVTDTDIRRLVRTEGVCTMRELSRQLGVATQCGKCGRCAKKVLRDAVDETRNEAACPRLVAA